MRKRGRPKGHEVTVIGLPAKRPRSKHDQKERVVPFIKLHSSVKERGSYTAFRSYSVEFRGYVMIPGYFVTKLWDCLHDYIFAAMLKWFVNDEVAIQVQRNKVLIEEEQVELSLVDENVDVEHFLQ